MSELLEAPISPFLSAVLFFFSVPAFFCGLLLDWQMRYRISLIIVGALVLLASTFSGVIWLVAP